MLDASLRLAWPATLALILLAGRAASAQYGLQPAPPPPAAAQPTPGVEPHGVEPHAASPTPAPTTPEPSEAELDRARALFGEGLTFVAQEDWDNAADRFTQVHAIRPSPVVSYNLASALTHLGKLVESSKLLTQVLSDAQADEETRRAAQLLLSKIEPGIGTLWIHVYGNAEGCSYALDDQPLDLGAGPLTVRLDPGLHRVTVVRDGAAILSPQITIGGAFPMQAQLSLEIPPKVRPVEAVVLPPPRKQPELRLSQPSAKPVRDESVFEQWWLWAGAGAVVAAGVITTLLLTSSDDPKPVAGDTVIHTRVVTGGMP